MHTSQCDGLNRACTGWRLLVQSHPRRRIGLLNHTLTVMNTLGHGDDAQIPIKENQNYLIGVRRFRPDDAPLLFSAVCESLQALCQFMTWCRPDYSLEDSQGFIARCHYAWEQEVEYNFAIIDARDKTLIGSIGLNRIDWANHCANIGFWVRQTWTRRGVATATARLIAEFGLRDLGLQRLELMVPAHNLASLRVAAKLGAKFEGVLRNRVFLANQAYDACVFGLVLADLTSPTAL